MISNTSFSHVVLTKTMSTATINKIQRKNKNVGFSKQWKKNNLTSKYNNVLTMTYQTWFIWTNQYFSHSDSSNLHVMYFISDLWYAKLWVKSVTWFLIVTLIDSEALAKWYFSLLWYYYQCTTKTQEKKHVPSLFESMILIFCFILI